MARKTRPAPPPAVLEAVAARFRLLGDPSRLRLLGVLFGAPHSVQDLVEATGLTQTNVSRHLGLLRREGLVTRTRVGNQARYALADRRVASLWEMARASLAEQTANELQALHGEGI